MAIVNGNDVGLYVNNQLIGCLTGCTFTSSNEEIDVTCKDNDGARQVLAGGNTSSFSFEGNFNPASTYGFGDLLGIHSAKTLVGIKQQVSTTLQVYAYGYLNEISWEGPLNAASTFSGTFAVSGTWSYQEGT
jgi:predicted secreted protein